MRGKAGGPHPARGLLAALVAAALVLFPIAGSARARAAGPIGATTLAAVPADASVTADPAGGGHDSWRSAIRVPRAAQPVGTPGLAALPAAALATGLVLLLLAGRRAADRGPAPAHRRLRAVRGPPASVGR